MHIYYLNLDQRQDRRDFMERQFARLDLDATRISAATPDSLDPALVQRHCRRPPSDGPSLLLRELACSVSHQMAWQRMLADGHDRAVVLEDDIFVSAQLGNFLTQLQASPLPHDIVRIETRQGVARVSKAIGSIGNIGLHRFSSYETGSSGYVITADCARRLLADETYFTRAVDNALFDPRSPLFARIDVVRTLPGLCIPAEYILGFGLPGVQSSDIHASRLESAGKTAAKPPRWQRTYDYVYDRLLKVWMGWYKLADRYRLGGRQRFVRFEP